VLREEQLTGFVARVPQKTWRSKYMATKLFVGSLSYNTTDEGLEEAFSAVGKVTSAKVIMDRDTNRSKGFGFVEMSSDDEAKAAVEQLNGKELDGRTIIVTEARPREDRGGERRSFGGGGGGDRGGNRGGFSNRY
jgi:RNA recognition motif-containing protein